MAKNVSITKVVSTATVFGPTEIDAAKAALDALPGDEMIFRSDYLDKLENAIGAKDEKYLVAVRDITIEELDSAKGIDGDHPYVTYETPAKRSEGCSKTYRAWRYIAILD
jgi:hypothetical protein